jgi:hypothetical protein
VTDFPVVPRDDAEAERGTSAIPELANPWAVGYELRSGYCVDWHCKTREEAARLAETAPGALICRLAVVEVVPPEPKKPVTGPSGWRYKWDQGQVWLSVYYVGDDWVLVTSTTRIPLADYFAFAVQALLREVGK